jgi:photosystem II stability/assembly factor-like uncharacterized protein
MSAPTGSGRLGFVKESYLNRQLSLLGLLVSACVYCSVTVAHAEFRDPLDVPAVASARATASMLVAVTRTPGGHWVAVGRRGHILLSSDTRVWQQATQVPVSTDLVGVYFISDKIGWVVGHGGIILKTIDAGQTWSKQLDGRQAADMLIAHYETLSANGDKSPALNTALEDAQRFKKYGPGRPFLDIWFADENHGYAIGAYNLLFGTEDGGKTWTPQVDRISNEKGLHLGTIRSLGSNLFIAGEQGFLARFDPARQRFETVVTPYQGSFFGLAGNDALLILFGLQGNAYLSKDNGRSWEKLDAGVAGTITSGTVLDDGRVVLANQAGTLAVSDQSHYHFTVVQPANAGPTYGLAPGKGSSVVIVGARGVRAETLK